MSNSLGKRAPPPQLIFDDGSRVMTDEAYTEETTVGTPASIRGEISLETYYEIDRITTGLIEQFNKDQRMKDNNNMFRVALQFPDELLDDSPDVCWMLEETLSKNLPESIVPFVFCLGDTTVGSCCPDEVAALHLQADIMVHYGHACLSPTGTLPVIYSFGRLEMDVSATVEAIVKEEDSIPEKILLLYQVGYHHAIDALDLTLRQGGATDVVVGRLPEPTRKLSRRPVATHSTCCDGKDEVDGSCCEKEANTTNHISIVTSTSDTEHDSATEVISTKKPLVIGGLELPNTIAEWEDLEGYTMLYIGESRSTSKRQFVNIMLRFLSLSAPPTAYWSYSPKSKEFSTSIPVALQKTLNRRFFLTQKARDANVFGILVSNLSQQHLVDVVKTLKKRIDLVDKSSYSFAVGKINPAKLANFAEIECFVLVACREHSLLNDEREYPIPVITPLELDVALGNLEWGAQAYSLDCQDVLETRAATGENSAFGPNEDNDDHDAPYFSLVTGKYMQKASVTAAAQKLDLENLPGQGKITAYKSEAAKFLKQREYQGLKTNAGETEVKAASLGQQGIASDYSGT